jgi:hypothetical protein
MPLRMRGKQLMVDRRFFGSFQGILSLMAVLALAGVLWADMPHEPMRLTVTPSRFTLAGLQEGRQLLVTLEGKDRRPHDRTREMRYATTPPGIVHVTAEGYVRPVREGQATVHIEGADQPLVVSVTVRNLDDTRPIHFANDIEPLLTRHGCNAGGCHGKASGQNGFKLSLFGFDADFDYGAIVKEARGRRVFPAAPDHSALLAKPGGKLPHGGGKRFSPESETYHLLKRWIAQGMPVGSADAPTFRKLEVIPRQRVLNRQDRQQLALLAHYSDGSVRDVTRQAQYQSNEPAVAAVDEDGLVRTLGLAGEATIMGRYMGQVAVFQATIPLGKVIAQFPDFAAANYIDRLALAKWKKLGLVPSDLCTDGEFIRRVVLDLCGKLPSADNVRAFLADQRPDKRARLIDRCLTDKDYAAYFALRWGSLLRNAAKQDGSAPAAYAFHEWIRDMIARNRPYDEFVRGILTAAGEWQDAAAINWYWQMRDDPLHQPVADTAQLFLGLRLQCARCHHHPYERWSQDDYYGLVGFFGRLGSKDIDTEPTYFVERKSVIEELHPRTGQAIEPKLPDGPVLSVPPGEDPRQKLVVWMVRPDNPFFAKALCNRMWSYLLGRGLVDPVDDMRETNPPSNPELLDALAKDFIAHRFDVKHLLRTICNSRTYQLSCIPNEYNRHDRQNHARYFGKRLLAEVFHDAVDQVCGTRTQFNNMPGAVRAIDLPHEGFDSYFLDVFDRPDRSSACECARSSEASLSQVLHLAYSPEIEDKIAADDGRLAKLLEKKVPLEKLVEELYLTALARYPTAQETKYLEHLRTLEDPRRGLEDLLWTLLNSREFLFNH